MPGQPAPHRTRQQAAGGTIQTRHMSARGLHFSLWHRVLDARSQGSQPPRHRPGGVGDRAGGSALLGPALPAPCVRALLPSQPTKAATEPLFLPGPSRLCGVMGFPGRAAAVDTSQTSERVCDDSDDVPRTCIFPPGTSWAGLPRRMFYRRMLSLQPRKNVSWKNPCCKLLDKTTWIVETAAQTQTAFPGCL